MTLLLVTGGIAGLGIFLFVFGLMPRKISLARRVAAFDAGASLARPATSGYSQTKESAFTRAVGAGIVRFCAEQGWQFPSLRASLRLTGRSLENYLATKALLGLVGLIFVPIIAGLLSVAGFNMPFVIPIWLGVLFGILFFFLPDIELRSTVTRMRRDFRHAIGAFLDLVAMNLAGGRGVPEALMTASEIGTGWAFWRIRQALMNARISGQTPWQALGALGEEVRVDELRDLASSLSLVADDGAKIRESLATRAMSLRRRELADMQGQAGEKSQSMLLAQMLLCAAFMLFLMYPAIRTLMGTG